MLRIVSVKLGSRACGSGDDAQPCLRARVMSTLVGISCSAHEEPSRPSGSHGGNTAGLLPEERLCRVPRQASYPDRLTASRLDSLGSSYPRNACPRESGGRASSLRRRDGGGSDKRACTAGRGPKRVAFDYPAVALCGLSVPFSLSAPSLRAPPARGRRVAGRRPAKPRLQHTGRARRAGRRFFQAQRYAAEPRRTVVGVLPESL